MVNFAKDFGAERYGRLILLSLITGHQAEFEKTIVFHSYFFRKFKKFCNFQKKQQ